jgi:CRP/FNR family transcriptional regulator, anaerobic regulatory protein
MVRRNPCSECGIRSRALCCALPPEQLAALNRISYRRRYPAGRLISGIETEDWFANVLSGVVKLTKTLADGRQQIVQLLFPSDFLGRPFRAGAGYVAEAATAVELCCFSRQPFESLMHAWSPLKQLFLERTLDEVEAAREWMLLLGRKSAEEKVAALILLVLRRMRPAGCGAAAQPDSVRFDLPLSRTEMADFLGLRIETVSRQLAILREAGVIETARGRTVVVRDVAALERMTEVDGAGSAARRAHPAKSALVRE